MTAHSHTHTRTTIGTRFSDGDLQKIKRFSAAKHCTDTESVRRIVQDWFKQPQNLKKVSQ